MKRESPPHSAFRGARRSRCMSKGSASLGAQLGPCRESTSLLWTSSGPYARSSGKAGPSQTAQRRNRGAIGTRPLRTPMGTSSSSRIDRGHDPEAARNSTRVVAPNGAARSSILIISLLQPTQHLGVDLIARGEFNLDPHGLVNLRRLEPPAGLPTFQSEAEIDAIPCRRLDPCERPSRRDERDKRLPGLNRDVAKARCSVDERVEDRAELWPVRVLSVNELIGGGEEEIRVAESFHDEERLRVAGHALLGEPRTDPLLVVESLPLDASIPR